MLTEAAAWRKIGDMFAERAEDPREFPDLNHAFPGDGPADHGICRALSHIRRDGEDLVLEYELYSVMDNMVYEQIRIAGEQGYLTEVDRQGAYDRAALAYLFAEAADGN